MSNVECRRNDKSEWQNAIRRLIRASPFRHYFVIRHSGFVI
jgi:hypothetical protein